MTRLTEILQTQTTARLCTLWDHAEAIASDGVAEGWDVMEAIGTELEKRDRDQYMKWLLETEGVTSPKPYFEVERF